MVQVGAYSTRSDAELAQTALAAAGIPSASRPTTPVASTRSTSRGARLLVDETDAGDSAAVLSQHPHGEEQR
jgi:hypothetical protein